MGLARPFVVLLVMVMLSTACDTDLRGDDPPPESIDQVEAIPLPPADAGPTMSGKPRKSGGKHEMYSVSADVELGQAYIFELDARCGFGHRVDFAGRLWDAVDKPPELKGQKVTGRMTLTNPQVAEFVSDDGIRIRFIRHPGKKFAVPCDQAS